MNTGGCYDKTEKFVLHVGASKEHLKSSENRSKRPEQARLKPAFVSFICPHCFNDVEIQDTEDTIWNQSIKNIGK